MTESKHTPGPWNMVFDNRNDALCIWNKEKDFLIASIALLGVKGEIEKRRFADFNLIAAAPDMYEALKCACDQYCIGYAGDSIVKCEDCIIGNALRKAKGEKNDRD